MPEKRFNLNDIFVGHVRSFTCLFATKSAGEARYSVLLNRHASEPLSSRFADIRLSNISTTVNVFAAGDVILAAVGSRSVQSGSNLTKHVDFRHGHALFCQRKMENSTKHDRNWNCK